jgi:hypothetical protein
MNIKRKMSAVSLLLTLLLMTAFAQDNNLPEYGSISDVKNLQRLYLATDSTDARKLILRELKKTPDLEVVPSSDKAEYFIEYKVLRQKTGQTSANFTIYTSEMVVYTLRNGRKVIAWSKTETSGGIGKPNEVNLTRHFLDALKKARREKT